MNTQKSVFNKISKIEREVESKEVELSEVQKVELSLISDIDRALDRAIKSEQNLTKLAQSLSLDANTAALDYQIAINLGKNALEKAKELGADDLVRVIQGRISEAEVGKKEMDSIVSKVKSMNI